MINPTDKDIGRKVIYFGRDYVKIAALKSFNKLIGDGRLQIWMTMPNGADQDTHATAENFDWADDL